MRILVVTQYFWPESFRINDVCIGLIERGHEVTVLTGKPNYPTGKFYPGYTFFNKRTEVWNGIKIYRSGLIPRGDGGGVKLLLNYISFAILAVFKVMFINEKFDKIFVNQLSPVTVGIPAIFAKYKFKVPIYFWVQDLWPQSLAIAGGVKNKHVLSFFDKLTKYIYKHCKVILVQSNAFKTYLNQQGVDLNKVIYYPNSTENFYKKVQPVDNFMSKLPKGFNLMFAGNLGEAQNFDTLLAAAKKLEDKDIQINWCILGDGRMKKHIQSKIKEYKLTKSFLLLGSYPTTDMPNFFACADALLVSLKKADIFAMTIPSKIQSYLACGKPIIGVLDGEGARVILESKSGYVTEAENTAGLVEIIEKMVDNSQEERAAMGNNARKYYEQEFEREKLLDKLEIIFTE
jgi:glycosyltransferase involved in cell wall biosynthesis